MTDPAFALTNDDGRYEFSGLAPGTYRVSATPEMISPRYVSPNFAKPGMPVGKPIEVADGQKVEAQEIR
jgi:hypothetical protein